MSGQKEIVSSKLGILNRAAEAVSGGKKSPDNTVFVGSSSKKERKKSPLIEQRRSPKKKEEKSPLQQLLDSLNTAAENYGKKSFDELPFTQQMTVLGEELKAVQATKGSESETNQALRVNIEKATKEIEAKIAAAKHAKSQEEQARHVDAILRPYMSRTDEQVAQQRLGRANVLSSKPDARVPDQYDGTEYEQAINLKLRETVFKRVGIEYEADGAFQKAVDTYQKFLDTNENGRMEPNPADAYSRLGKALGVEYSGVRSRDSDSTRTADASDAPPKSRIQRDMEKNAQHRASHDFDDFQDNRNRSPWETGNYKGAGGRVEYDHTRDMRKIEEHIEHLMDQIELQEQKSSREAANQFRGPYATIIDALQFMGEQGGYQGTKDAAEIGARINNRLALHDLNFALTYPPFNKERLETLRNSGGEIVTKDLLGEMSREIAGVKAPIGKVAMYLDELIPRMLHQKDNSRMEMKDLLVGLDQELSMYVQRMYENAGQSISDQERDRVIRLGKRCGLASLRSVTLIARDGQMDMVTGNRFERDPYGAVLKYFKPLEYLHAKYGTMEGGLMDALAKAAGDGDIEKGKDVINSWMSGYGDAFSSGWRMDRFLRALDQDGYESGKGKYEDFALWTRMQNPFYKDYQDKSGRDIRLGHLRVEALDKILHRDTHVLPLLGLFQKDHGFEAILHKHHLGSLGDIEGLLSEALFNKLQAQMNAVETGVPFTMGSLSKRDQDALNANQGLINDLQRFLQSKRGDIIDFYDLHGHGDHGHGKKKGHGGIDAPSYLWKKTISISDIPIWAMKDDDELNAQVDFFGRNIADDLSGAHQVWEQISALIRHPEDISKLLELSESMTFLSGFEGYASPTLKKMVQMLYEMNKPTAVSNILPEWAIDLMPGLYASEMQRWRGKAIDKWDIGGRTELIHRIESLGTMSKHDIHELEKLMHAQFGDRILPAAKFMVMLLVLTYLAAIVEEAKKEGSSGGGGGHGGGGHH